MSAPRGGKRSLPKAPFVAYLACRCCGHWWPLIERQLTCLISAAWFVCPYCAQGRKRACDDWDGETRRPPTPALLDIRKGLER